MWNNDKRPKIRVIGVSEDEEREYGTEENIWGNNELIFYKFGEGHKFIKSGNAAKLKHSKY